MKLVYTISAKNGATLYLGTYDGGCLAHCHLDHAFLFGLPYKIVMDDGREVLTKDTDRDYLINFRMNLCQLVIGHIEYGLGQGANTLEVILDEVAEVTEGRASVKNVEMLVDLAGVILKGPTGVVTKYMLPRLVPKVKRTRGSRRSWKH